MSGQVLFQEDAVMDAIACQEYLQLLGPVYGAEVFFFSDLEGVCYLLDSPDRSCVSMSGPAAPSMAECEEATTTSTSTTTTTTTTKPDKCKYVISKFLEDTSLNGQVNQSLFPDGVLITGSDNVPWDTAELYLPSARFSCSLPKLPDYRDSHTLESSGLVCGGWHTSDTCLQWSHGSWSWEEELHLDTKRDGHVSWTPDTDICTYLIGGYPSYNTTTLIRQDGTQGPGFPLQYDTE